MAIFFVFPNFFGAAFVSSTDERLKTILELAEIKKGERVVDLGSGDGKIVIRLACKGIRVDGIEINPILVFKSKKEIKNLSLEKKAQIFFRNFWRTDISPYDVVILYGSTHIMKRMEKKLQKELKPGARVISNHFQFPTWSPAKEKNKVFLYKKTKSSPSVLVRPRQTRRRTGNIKSEWFKDK